MSGTENRLSEGYEPRWDLDYEVGRQGELFVRDIIESLGKDAIEIKTDEKAVHTGRVYIETQCLFRDGWKPSGITTTEADYCAYVVGGSLVIVVPTRLLRQAISHGIPAECKKGTHPTKGVLMSLGALFAACFHYIKKESA